MTIDSMKRAEELFEATIGDEPVWSKEFIITCFVKSFQAVAQEARREENEACAKTCEDVYGDPNWAPLDWPTPEDCAKAVRSRMHEQEYSEIKAVKLIKPLPDHEVGEVFNLEGDGFIQFRIFHKEMSFYPKHWPEYFEECVIKNEICNCKCHEEEEC